MEDKLKKFKLVVEEAMIQFGPDGHCDGAGRIAEYIYFRLFEQSKSQDDFYKFKQGLDNIIKNGDEIQKSSDFLAIMFSFNDANKKAFDNGFKLGVTLSDLVLNK